MKCAMLDIITCSRGSYEVTKKIFIYILKQITMRGSIFPPMYVKWIKTMMEEGTALFRLYTIMVHALFDVEYSRRLFKGESEENVIAFTERLNDKLSLAFLGRKPNGLLYTKHEISQNMRCQRVAEVVCSMQDHYLSL